MEGSGVTNYATDRPSYAYSNETTEFDDALLQRGIVTADQVLLAKGASLTEVERLIQLKTNNGTSSSSTVNQQQQGADRHQGDDDSDDDSFLLRDDEDDAFMERYRQDRLAELRQTADKSFFFGASFRIDRTEWTRHVNEASHQTWVVVCLTSNDPERTLEHTVTELASHRPTIKFVLIPAHQAIENWPQHNLPTLFLYRDGSMKRQLIQLPCDMSAEELNELLEPIWKGE